MAVAAATPDASDFSGRRDIGGEDHMLNAMTSAPSPPRHGRGRRHIDEPDHLFSPAGVADQEDSWTTLRRGRKPLPVQDELRDGLLAGGASGPTRSPLKPEEVKESVKEFLTNTFGMSVADEQRWAEASLEQHGKFWKLVAMTEHRLFLSREGANARAIAEKLSLSPVSDVRYFGLRFGGDVGDKPTPKRSLGLVGEDNPTYVSSGVHRAMDPAERQQQPDRLLEMSSSRKDPEEMSRRYIRSGQDHWSGAAVSTHGNGRGEPKDLSYENGLERCIGRGRRHFEKETHLSGVGATLRT